MTRISLSVLTGVSLWAAGAQGADIAVADAAGLRGALLAANGGDRLLLAAGNYGDFDITGLHFNPAVTMTASDSAAAPVFSSLDLRDVGGLALSDLKIIYGTTNAPLTSYAVNIANGDGISLTRLEVLSADNQIAGDDAYGVNIRDSANVVLEDSNLHDVYRAVAAFDSTDVVIRHNAITRVGSDGVVARGAVRMTIEQNYFADFDVIDPTVYHADAIQFWSRDALRANQDVIIRGNLIRRGSGDPSQGIFVNTPEIASQTILIEENVIEQSMGQGVFVLNGDGVVVRRNTIIPHDFRTDAPGLEIRAPAAGVVIENNIAVAYRLGAAVAATGNVLADYYNPWISEFVERLLVDAGDLSTPGDYVAKTIAGAAAFVSDVWIGDGAPPSGSLAPPAIIADLDFRGGIVDYAPDPVAIAPANSGGLDYWASEPSPKLSAALNLTIDADVRAQANGAWQLVAAVPNSYDIRIKNDRIKFSLWTLDGAVTRLDGVSLLLLDSAVHALSAKYDGATGEISILLDGDEIAHRAAPVGPVAYNPTQKLYLGGAPWGLNFVGQIETLKISR